MHKLVSFLSLEVEVTYQHALRQAKSSRGQPPTARESASLCYVSEGKRKPSINYDI